MAPSKVSAPVQSASAQSLTSEDFQMPTSLAGLKAVATNLGIEVTGNKTTKAAYVTAIETARTKALTFISNQSANAAAVVLEAESQLGSEAVAQTLADVAVEHGTTIVRILTGPTAQRFYRISLRSACFVVGLLALAFMTGLTILWEHLTKLNNEFAILPRIQVAAVSTAIDIVETVRDSQALADVKDMVALYRPNAVWLWIRLDAVASMITVLALMLYALIADAIQTQNAL